MRQAFTQGLESAESMRSILKMHSSGNTLTDLPSDIFILRGPSSSFPHRFYDKY